MNKWNYDKNSTSVYLTETKFIFIPKNQNQIIVARKSKCSSFLITAKPQYRSIYCESELKVAVNSVFILITLEWLKRNELESLSY